MPRTIQEYMQDLGDKTDDELIERLLHRHDYSEEAGMAAYNLIKERGQIELLKQRLAESKEARAKELEQLQTQVELHKYVMDNGGMNNVLDCSHGVGHVLESKLAEADIRFIRREAFDGYAVPYLEYYFANQDFEKACSLFSEVMGEMNDEYEAEEIADTPMMRFGNTMNRMLYGAIALIILLLVLLAIGFFD